MKKNLLDTILIIPAILIAFTFHEYAHAWVADKLGDKTPKFQGRLTLNPLAHIDPIGFIMILIFNFGWAKPVEVNPSAFRNYYKDDLKVSIAGPLANLLVAFVFSGIIAIIYKIVPGIIYSRNIIYIILKVFYITIQMNCMFAFFNIMPIPGLDGFHILRDIFPGKFYKFSDVMYRYQLVILMLFIVVPGVTNFLVGRPASFVYSLFLNIFNI
ncbi:Peptidase family M50 [Clostridium liquoris]|uniref:Peptidase family M50 n=1 Tax=Clostridium liquoris TaxID=1289519 RepID=A0A2T0B236_9CLOT|nr:site-2 protease family protein [Clostridium liquoris]PRR77720.1 Peptidase family M50 [Clostridium liquoris]